MMTVSLIGTFDLGFVVSFFYSWKSKHECERRWLFLANVGLLVVVNFSLWSFFVYIIEGCLLELRPRWASLLGSSKPKPNRKDIEGSKLNLVTLEWEKEQARWANEQENKWPKVPVEISNADLKHSRRLWKSQETNFAMHEDKIMPM